MMVIRPAKGIIPNPFDGVASATGRASPGFTGLHRGVKFLQSLSHLGAASGIFAMRKNQPEVRSPERMTEAAQNMLATWGTHWLDIGSGDGRSLGMIAHAKRDREVLGVDYKDATPAQALKNDEVSRWNITWPHNTRCVLYCVNARENGVFTSNSGAKLEYQYLNNLDSGLYEAIAKATIEMCGEGTRFDAVSILFPYADKPSPLEKLLRLRAHQKSPTELQIEMAMRILTPGGRCLMVTEDPFTLKKFLDILQKHGDVARIVYSDTKVNMENLGLAPYSFSANTFSPDRADYAVEARRVKGNAVNMEFHRAYVLMFQKK